MPQSNRPTWQLPTGVSRATWDYVHHPDIAKDYDEYFAENSLFEHDQSVAARHFQPPGVVTDLGCGTARALVPLVRRGHRGVAVDLSLPMLHIAQQKAQLENLPIHCLCANLTQLDALRDNSTDYAMCLFSTLGMIRRRVYRREALDHFRRILKPRGKLVLHVHNYWHNLRDPWGPWWLLKNLCTAPFSREVEWGDKWFAYRGLPRMYLHVFRWSELSADLRRSGLDIVERIPLDTARRHPLRWPWFCQSLRANGWIVVCQRQ